MSFLTKKRFVAALVALSALAGMLGMGTHALFTDSTANPDNDVSSGSITAPNLAQPTATGGSVPLSWSASTLPGNASDEDEITYSVERKLGSGSFGPAVGACTDIAATSCTDTVGASGSYTYRVVAEFRGWTATSNERTVTVTIGGGAPSAPTTVALANGGGVGNAYINDANEASLNVNVGLPASSVATDTVHVTITDGTNTTVDKTTAASAGAGTVTVTGIDATSLNDGSVTIRAHSSNGSGNSTQTTTSATKDTVKPSSAAGTVADITSGNTFTVPYTSGDTSPSSSLQKVELYVDTPDAPATFSLTNTDTSPSATGESFSYTGATTDGTYGFYTRAYDNAGNVEDAPGAADVTATRTTATFRMATGSYVGNGVDNRTIAGLGFQPDVVIVKASTNQIAAIRTSTMPSTGNNTKPLVGATGLTGSMIKTLTSDGFVLGTNAAVNSGSGGPPTYSWIAFKAAPGFLTVGSYSGNATAGRNIAVGFEPEYAAVMSAGSNRAVQHYSGMTSSYQFDSNNGAANRITGFVNDGFTVSNGAEVNSSGTYHYVAFNHVAGSIFKGSYTGDAAADRQITGVGFQPDYVMMRANANRNGHHRAAALTGTSSAFFDGTANTSTTTGTGIKALESDGFRVGSENSVNANNDVYHYLAFKNTDGGSSLFSTLSGTNAGDSWVNQASPSANLGGDSVLKVTSKSSNSNTRALVQFTLPAIPSGMSVKHSSLYLNNTATGAAGRTIQAFRAAATWTESGVTWTNQPATTGTAATALTTSTTGFLEWTVGSLVSAMYPTASNNFGFILRDQTEDDGGGKEQQFSSEEASAAQRPRLDVTFGN